MKKVTSLCLLTILFGAVACEPQRIDFDESGIGAAETSANDVSLFSKRTNEYEEIYYPDASDLSELYSDLNDAWISSDASGQGSQVTPLVLTTQGFKYHYVTKRDINNLKGLEANTLSLELSIGSVKVATFWCSGDSCDTIDFICQIIEDGKYYHECLPTDDRNDLSYGINRYVLSQLVENLNLDLPAQLEVTITEKSYRNAGDYNFSVGTLQLSRVAYIQIPTWEELGF